MKLKKRVIIIATALIMLFAVFGLIGCDSNREANMHFTNEQHIERITQRVQERFFADGSDYPYIDFTVTILYSLAGYADFFMVQFEPGGFFYGTIWRNEYYVAQENWFTTRFLQFAPHDILYRFRNAFENVEVTNERKYIYRFLKVNILIPVVRINDYFVSVDGQDIRVSSSSMQRASAAYRGRRIVNL